MIDIYAGDDPLLGRLERVVEACPKRGDIGAVAVDEFPDSGRIMVPTTLLAVLTTIARAQP